MQDKPEIRTLPWYGMIHGFAVVPDKGAVSSNAPGAGVLVLMEGAHLILFELPDLHPHPISLPLQELPEITCCQLAESASADVHVTSHTLTLEQLKVSLGQSECDDPSIAWRFACKVNVWRRMRTLHAVDFQRGQMKYVVLLTTDSHCTHSSVFGQLAGQCNNLPGSCNIWDALQAAQGSDLPAGAGQRWRWAFSGGKPASPGTSTSDQSDLLLTGIYHRQECQDAAFLPARIFA